MKPALSIVLQPPPFTLRAGRFDDSGKVFWGEVEFRTPRGPAHVMVKVTLPETAKVLWTELAPAMLTRAAERVMRGSASAGAFGVSLPSPRKVLRRGAKVVNASAKAAANRAVAKVPKPMRKVVAMPLQKIAKAKNATELVRAVEDAAIVLGSSKIPGTGIPLTALHPYGAAAAYGSKILGEQGTKEVLEEAAQVVTDVLADETPASDEGESASGGYYAAGALKRIGKKIVKQKALSVAKDLSLNAKFAKEVGIPTLDVSPDLHDASRMLVSVLRGVYLRNPQAVAKLQRLSDAATKGDKNARILWALADKINKAAAQSRVGYFAAGDGFGEGYGRAGYLPPPSPVSLYRLQKG